MNVNFYPLLKKYIGVPFRYLEIGVFRGTTIKWVLDNIATHKDSKLYGVDPWERNFFSKRDIKDDSDWYNLLNTISRIQDTSNYKVTFLKGCVHNKIHTFGNNYFDVIYIDGRHTINDVIVDYAYSWRLLKQNGIMIFDDYNQIPVKIAVDTILTGLYDKYSLLFVNRQLGIRKT